MKLSLPKNYTNKIVKAVAEFDLIENGDHILVGLSGGKDSIFLLYTLAFLRKYLGVKFSLSAITIDYGFDDVNFSPLREFCHELAVPFYLKKTRIAEYILQEEIANPCAKCAHFRKGAIVGFMREKGIKKLAFGHHYDDAVETFLMSILYSGQLVTFQPKQYLSNNDIYIIRPLVYLREKDIVEAGKLLIYKPINSPCPYDGKTKREEIKGHLKKFTEQKQVFYNLAAAMREGASLERWPQSPLREELSRKIKKLWQP